jgi:tetratricopeptide (TPR) repeat protein
LARGYASIQDWPQAETYFSRLIEGQPENVEWYWQRGQIRQELASDTGAHNLAAADFREVLRRNPDHWEARLKLVQCLLSNAQMEEAKAELLRCRQLDPKRVEPLLGLASCALEEQNWKHANDLLSQALELQWNSSIALSMKGDLHLFRQQYAEAISYYQKVLVVEPANKAAHLKLAQAYRLSGRLEDAKIQEEAYQRLQRQSEKEERGSRRP